MRFTTLHITEHPTGRFGFVGRVPCVLGYERRDGTPLTEKDKDAIAHCGPGILRNTVRSRSWETEEAARAEAERLGFEVAS